MNSQSDGDSAHAEKLLKCQRPLPAGEPLPGLPADLRRQWSAHFRPRGRTVERRAWLLLAGLAAAASLVGGLILLDRIASERVPVSPIITAPSPAEPADPWKPREPQSLSPIAQALLEYRDSSTAGLYVRQ